jgi:hypothetical protein
MLVIFVSVISAFTAPVATDHPNYVYMFENIKTYPFSEVGLSFIGSARVTQIETGYMMLNWILAKIGFTEPFFFLAIALIINTAIVNYVYKHRLPIFTVAYIYIGGLILINEQNLVRQFVATSVFLFALLYLEKGQWIKYVLIVFAATLFHASAIVLIPFFLCGYNRWKATIQTISTGGNGGQKIMAGLYVLSVLSIAIPILAQNILFFSFFNYYDIYQNSMSGVGMSTPIVYAFFYNAIAIVAILRWTKTPTALAACAVAMAMVYNFSFSVPNALRLQSYFLVPTVVYLFHQLLSSPKGSPKPFGGQVTKFMLIVVGLYIVESALNNFLFTKSLLLSDTYKIEDFLSIF